MMKQTYYSIKIENCNQIMKIVEKYSSFLYFLQ